MMKLLEVKGSLTIQKGKWKGTRYDALSQEQIDSFAKKAPEPELRNFCRCFLMLQELEEKGLQTDNPTNPAQLTAGTGEDTTDLAVVPYTAKGSKKTILPQEQSPLADIVVAARGKLCRLASSLPVWAKVILLMLCARFGALALTSPLVAQKAGELCGNMVNMCFLRVGDFLATFQTELLRTMGFYPKVKVVAHELDIGTTFAGQSQSQEVTSPWNQFVHEIGTAFLGSLCTIVGGSVYFFCGATATQTT